MTSPFWAPRSGYNLRYDLLPVNPRAFPINFGGASETELLTGVAAPVSTAPVSMGAGRVLLNSGLSLLTLIVLLIIIGLIVLLVLFNRKDSQAGRVVDTPELALMGKLETNLRARGLMRVAKRASSSRKHMASTLWGRRHDCYARQCGLPPIDEHPIDIPAEETTEEKPQEIPQETAPTTEEKSDV